MSHSKAGAMGRRERFCSMHLHSSPAACPWDSCIKRGVTRKGPVHMSQLLGVFFGAAYINLASLLLCHCPVPDSQPFPTLTDNAGGSCWPGC